MYPSLIVKRERMSSENSNQSEEYNSNKHKKDRGNQFRTQSRISFFQNEKLAEKISREHSIKKEKRERDHLGLLSVMDEKKKLIPVTRRKSRSKSKEKGELINKRFLRTAD